MKRTTLIAGATLVALGLTTVTASAHQMRGEGPRGPKITFEELDANGDGQLTTEEMTAHAQARFNEKDADGNGSLSADEMASGIKQEMQDRMQRRSAKMIKRLDDNGDGEISFDEMQAMRRGNLIEKLDSDGDGQVSAEEFAEMREKFQGRKRHRMGGHGN